MVSESADARRCRSDGQSKAPPPPPFAAEVESDRIPELLGEIERLRAVLWARLTRRYRAWKSDASQKTAITSASLIGYIGAKSPWNAFGHS